MMKKELCWVGDGARNEAAVSIVKRSREIGGEGLCSMVGTSKVVFSNLTSILRSSLLNNDHDSI